MEQQNDTKKQKAEALFAHPVNGFLQIGPVGFRDHFDLRVQNQELGFMSRDIAQSFTLDHCLLGTSGLRAAFERLKTYHFPIQKGSLRLRHSDFMKRPGLWLDFSHLDVKSLFEEKNLLKSLSQEFFVEVGQRRKPLVFKGDFPHLQKEPLFEAWSQTFLEDQKIPLFGQVASFTQTGYEAIKKLSTLLQQKLDALKTQRILELGAGLGTLSFPALSKDRKLNVVENDPFALKALHKTKDWVKDNLGKDLRLHTHRGDFQRLSQEQLQDESIDTLLVNPPRSGLMKSSEAILLQKNLIYVSCSADSAHRDHLILRKNYNLKELFIIDQFPWTTHFELMLVYQKK